MPKIGSKVHDALQEPDAKTFAPEYLKAIREAAYAADTSVISSARTVFVLAVVFELLRGAVVSEVSLLGVKISDVGLVLRFIPVATAFLYYRYFSQYIRLKVLIQAHNTIVKDVYSAYFKHDLHLLLFPPTFAPEQLIIQHASGFRLRAFNVVSTPIALAFLLGPIAFLVYSYYRCFALYGTHNTSTWVSLIVSSALLIQTVVYAWAGHDLFD